MASYPMEQLHTRPLIATVALEGKTGMGTLILGGHFKLEVTPIAGKKKQQQQP